MYDLVPAISRLVGVIGVDDNAFAGKNTTLFHEDNNMPSDEYGERNKTQV